MKFAFLLPGLLIATAACVTNTEFDRDRAYSKCESITQKTSRDRCIADAIAEAERERARDDARDQQREDDAEKRALGRAIAGVDGGR